MLFAKELLLPPILVPDACTRCIANLNMRRQIKAYAPIHFFTPVHIDQLVFEGYFE